MDNQLVAIFEARRLSFLLGFIQYPEKFSAAHAYAVFHRVCPIFHEGLEGELHGSDPYKDLYQTKEFFIDEVLQYIDEKHLERDFESLDFYKLEDKFGGYKNNRIELIRALDYIRLDNRFDDEVWDAIYKLPPAEAKTDRRDFLPSDVYFS